MEVSVKKTMTTKVLVMASLLVCISIVLTRFVSIMIPLAGLPAIRFGIGSIPIIMAGILYGPSTGALVGIVADLIGCFIFPQGTYFIGFTISAALRGMLPALMYGIIKKRKIEFDFTFINICSMLAIFGGVIYIMVKKGVLSIVSGQIYLYEDKMPLVYIVLGAFIVLSFVILPIIIKKKNTSAGIYSIDKITFIVTLPYIIISLGLNTLWLSILFKKGFMVFLPGRILSALIIIPLYTSALFTLSKVFKYMKVD
ncbi:folate family ECF transporter S component [Clostridiaceae bacterium M8S5]|nr:folate family ECF transporter S component [Clostridiaceae bacterium M8S5]